jgi:hypothetical protein
MALPEIRYYKVVPGGIEPCTLLEWADQWSVAGHHIWKDTIANVLVNTICLGFDVSCGFASVALFETAIIDGKGIKPVKQYSIYAEAEKGHKAIIDVLRKSNPLLLRDNQRKG